MTPDQWAEATRQLVARDAAELRAKSDIYRTPAERQAALWASLRGWLEAIADDQEQYGDDVLAAVTRAVLQAVADPANDVTGDVQ